MGTVRAALEEMCSTGHDCLTLYVGPSVAEVREALKGLPVRIEGPLPGLEVSRRFAAMDIYLAPFLDGVSTRRGSLMAALQHGVATAGTRGELTDEILLRADGRAFLLANVGDTPAYCAQALRLLNDPKLCRELGNEARRLYDNQFDWTPITRRLLSALQEIG
jgi:glycosyltransferase involved in cell wall biosynthesis